MRHSQSETIRKILYEHSLGDYSAESIAEKLCLAQSTVYIYARDKGVKLEYQKPSRRIPKEQRRESKADAVRQELERCKGASKTPSLENLCKVARLRPSGLPKLCRQFGIELPEDTAPYAFRPDINRLLTGEYSLRRIGQEIGVTLEAIRQYVQVSMQEKYWDRVRGQYLKDHARPRLEKLAIDSLKRLRRAREIIDIAVEHDLPIDNVVQNDWSLKQAVKYDQSVNSGRRISIARLYNIFKDYETAVRKRKRTSFAEIARTNNICLEEVYDIFKRVGLPNIYKGVKVSAENIELVRIVELGYKK